LERGLLLDGRVFLAGNNQSWLFNPANSTFTNGPALLGTRYRSGIATLPDGSVLMCGGWGATV